jgi:hypothetical protein
VHRRRASCLDGCAALREAHVVLAAAVVRNDHVAIGAHDNLLIIVWNQMPTMDDFGLVESATADLIQQNPTGIGLLIIIVENNDKPPSQAVRRRNAELVARYEGKLWGMARVIEGDGLKKGVIRFVLSTMDLLSNSALKERTVEDVGDAVKWLQSIQPRLHERGVLNEIEKVRRAQAPAGRSQERPAVRAR